MGKSGHVRRIEPDGPELCELFIKDGWQTYTCIIDGSNYAVSRAFAEGFDGETIKIPHLSFLVTEVTIAEATRLPIDGERWFKNRTLIGMDCTFLQGRTSERKLEAQHSKILVGTHLERHLEGHPDVFHG